MASPIQSCIRTIWLARFLPRGIFCPSGNWQVKWLVRPFSLQAPTWWLQPKVVSHFPVRRVDYPSILSDLRYERYWPRIPDSKSLFVTNSSLLTFPLSLDWFSSNGGQEESNSHCGEAPQWVVSTYSNCSLKFGHRPKHSSISLLAKSSILNQ